jgi:hypothetical protein
LMPIPNQGTDDRGEFRLVVAPGKYYVQATVQSFRHAQERPEIRSDGTSEAVYGTTFYPSAIRKERGTVVEAVAGKDVGGVEIRLARQQQALSISGVVSGFPEGQARAYVSMQSGESAQRMFSGGGTGIGADGKFRFDGLQPGFYRVTAQNNDGKPRLMSRSMEFQLVNSEIANVELVLLPPLELSGSVKMEGEEAGAAAPKRTVRLEPMGYSMGNMAATGGEMDGNGAFRVKVEPLAENAYLKALEIDGVAVTNGIADLSKVVRGASAKVTLGSNGAQISGRVLDSNDELLQNSMRMIFLASDPDDFPQIGGVPEHAGPDGKYILKGVAPGKYRLFAADPFQMSGVDSAEAGLEMFKKLFARGEEIEFKEGDRIVKDLKVISLEDANAKK